MVTMSRRYTHNYLRNFRKRSGLTQEEIAFLLGYHTGAQLSRYENLSREPSLATAFACQAIYRVPVHELFPGIYTVVESQVKRRAFVLDNKLDANQVDRFMERKTAFLHELEFGVEAKPRPNLWENPKQRQLF